MQKQRKNREARYNQLIQCATRVFAKRGYKGATTSEISRAAKVSEKMIYVHFKSKKALFLKCLERVRADLEDGFRQIIFENKDNPGLILEQYGLFLFGYIRNNRHAAGLLSLLVSETADRDIKNAYRKMLESYVSNVEHTIRIAIAKGVVAKDIDARALAWLYVGNYHTITMMREFEFPEFHRAFITKMVEMFNRAMTISKS